MYVASDFRICVPTIPFINHWQSSLPYPPMSASPSSFSFPPSSSILFFKHQNITHHIFEYPVAPLYPSQVIQRNTAGSEYITVHQHSSSSSFTVLQWLLNPSGALHPKDKNNHSPCQFSIAWALTFKTEIIRLVLGVGVTLFSGVDLPTWLGNASGFRKMVSFAWSSCSQLLFSLVFITHSQTHACFQSLALNQSLALITCSYISLSNNRSLISIACLSLALNLYFLL